ncbi:Ig-like domain-containing protein [Photobacterium sp. OFAV2-7]|uniref:Ig-like domain-containing protein n=1 Tax=Photobacterium sp. OFAV2-7 TaxID=2917748 RepID=UPI001EF5CB50|nr:Ig-like domain-containing protein [Photobacterium sp. OFAV2-7]MCG7588139.1 Ig-like domain-containing protein [Photobacterium sp. OFAV2-7]
MQKSLMATAILLSICAAGQAYAVNCSQLAIWEQGMAYNTGTQVQSKNIAYEANWWNIGNDPANHSGPWQEWTKLGQCDTNPGNQLPIVTLTSPLANAQFTENDIVVLTANANDSDGSVDSVEFFLGAHSLGSVITPPYTLNWKSVLGTHLIEARVTDNQGATSSDTVTISVVSATGNLPPTINLISPTASSQIIAGENITLTANATDDKGPVAKVDFYIDDQIIGTDTSAPYEYPWAAEAGTRSFKAKATDIDNAYTFSEIVTVAVSDGNTAGGCAGIPAYTAGQAYQGGNIVQHNNHKYHCDVAGWCSSDSAWAYEPGKGQYWADAWTDLGICAIVPEISITSPADNSTVLAGSNVTINAQATDADGTISQVQFYAGNQSVGTDTTAPFSANWQAVGLGDIAIKAVATDNEGNNGEASVLVSVSDQALVTSLTSPTSGTTVSLGQAFNLAATAESLNGSVQKVDFQVNGTIVATDTTAPYTANWTAGSAGNYTVMAIATDSQGATSMSATASVKVIEQSATKHKLIGYWHNFVNGAGCPMRLRDISPAWDVIDIAFADNDRNSDGTVHFNLYAGDIHSACPALSPEHFKQDVRDLRAQGKVIVLSLGGAEGTITLNTDADEVNFVNSLTQIMKEWGFDGLDIDLESGSNLLHGTQIQARLPRALKQIEANTGGNMYLTMAPEHPYVQGGMIAYSGIWGAYIPVIDQLRDMLNLLHVQLYNNGGLANPYMPGAAPEGSVDMMVASAKMLVEGFELADGTMFQPLRDDQVAIGLPSGPSSANSGQAPIQNIVSALDCLTVGTSCGTVVPAKLYPNFGGVMTWSINWDKHDGYNFSGPVGDKLKAMNGK